MRTLNLDIPADDTPLYLRLSRAIRGAVRAGQARPGELLPSTRVLAQACGAHRHTVMSALDELVAEGWLEAERGRGYRILATLPGDPPEAAAAAENPRVEWRVARDAILPQRTSEGLPFAFPSGQPDLRLFPVRDYYGCLRDTLRRVPAPSLLGYAAAGGISELTGELATYLRRLRGLSTERDIVVTHGSQEAIFLLGMLLLERGDVVAVEAMGYPPAWGALRASGARLAPVEVDAAGIVPEALDRLARRRPIRMVYVTPLHQYPTTVTLPVPRRAALYEVCARHGIAILEDDYDHEFHYRSSPLAPLAASNPDGRVLYVSTFSKVLYPAARIGFAVVPRVVAEGLRRLKHIASRQNDTLVQHTVARWMATGGFERHLRRMRREYSLRCDAMLAALKRESGGLRLEVRRPDGGMSLWVSLGVDDVALADAAAAAGVGIVAGRHAMLRPRANTWLRLGFASTTPDEIDEGVRRLCAAARSLR
ncbi:MAG: PLP-dependent aminotransferase family protein [Armatimonadetes bacterium]|nr:PLP-dependent aminotransferase family protein [Armatimonadota bacterium]